MWRNVFKLLMIWLLVGPPALCRAGVLVDCCEHSVQAAPEATAPPCCGGCDSTETKESSAPDPESRECGTCAGVCAVVAKPADELPPAVQMVTVIDRVHCSNDLAHPDRSGRYVPRDTNAPALPYPSSDLPLLI